MRNILLLVKKDFTSAISAYGNMWFFLFFYLFFAFNPGMIPFMFIMLTYMLVVALFQSEENDLVCNVTAILPVRRRDVVAARYIYTWIVLAGGFVLVSAACAAIQAWQGTDTGWQPYALVGAASALLMISIVIPLAYRFGVIKMRMLILIVYIGIAVLAGILGSLLGDLVPRNLTALSMGALLLAGCFLLSVLSMFPSMRRR